MALRSVRGHVAENQTSSVLPKAAETSRLDMMRWHCALGSAEVSSQMGVGFR